MEIGELKRKSHLILTLQHNGYQFDFVELCGSEMAATNLKLVGKQPEQERKFVSHSFNSLSQALI